MKIVSPVYLTGHTYAIYYQKSQELKNIKDSICIDIDFLHNNEIEPYIMTIALGAIKNQFEVRSRNRKKIEKIRKILKLHGVMYSQIGFGKKFYNITILN